MYQKLQIASEIAIRSNVIGVTFAVVSMSKDFVTSSPATGLLEFLFFKDCAEHGRKTAQNGEENKD